MADVSRREAVKLLGLMAAASTFSFGCGEIEVQNAQERRTAAGEDATKPGSDYQRQFFTDHEFETVTLLADMIIPADERSGSASDAGVPAFMDFVMSDDLLWGLEERQTAMRGGLAWLDYECLERFDDRLFVECSEAQRTQLLDLIAYPEDAPTTLAAGTEFFSSFRNMTASGFFSSKMGVEDLGYKGNVAHAWDGCPESVQKHVGYSA